MTNLSRHSHFPGEVITFAPQAGLPASQVILPAAPSRVLTQWHFAAFVADYGCGDSGGLSPPSLLGFTAPPAQLILKELFVTQNIHSDK